MNERRDERDGVNFQRKEEREREGFIWDKKRIGRKEW